MFSQYFINRPIFAFVISIFIMIAGLAAMRTLPVAQYPEIAPPTVQVVAVYPGASAEIAAQTVATPLENAINGVEDMLYMSSTSTSNGVSTITITFQIGADVDKAALNVNNRVKQVDARLPLEVRRNGVTVSKGSSAFLQVLAFYSPEERYDDLYISNYITLNVLDKLKRIPGTTNVQIFGAKDYAMRIWVKPDQLTKLGLTITDVGAALTEQNAQFAAGKIGQSPTKTNQEMVYSITTKGRLSTVEEFEDIILRANDDGSLLRLKDVARVQLGSKDYEFRGRINGNPSTLIGVFLQPGANALSVADEVQGTVKTLAESFPDGLVYSTPYDTTRFVEVSIREVLKTLGEAMLLVFLVVYLFLQNWRATLIPTLAVPVSLLGTFAGLQLLGYSINTLTLFGMVLSIGIVVDDAIVVLENVERIMHEEGLKAREAAFKAMKEVSGPIVAIVLVLVSVFVPIAFLGGLSGELYRQFAITISISVTLSGVVALTMTPALCVLILKHEHKGTNFFFRGFNTFFTWVTRRYVGTVGFMIRHSFITILLFMVMVAATVGLWKITPNSLVPDEDQGYYIAAVFLPDGASLDRTDKVVSEVLKAIKSNPNNENVVAFTGFDFLGGGYKNSAATMFVTQKHWDDRDVPTKALVGELFAKTAHIKEALVLAFNPPAIFGLGSTGGFEFYLQNKGEGGSKALAAAMDKFKGAAQQDPRLGRVNSLWRPATPQLFINVDRERAKSLGISLDSAFNTLAAGLGSYYVNDFNKFGRAWQVLLSADAEYRKTPDDVGRMYVRSNKGEMVPLSAFAKVEYSSGPDTIDRFNNLPAVKLMGEGAPGVSSGQALDAVEDIAKKSLSSDFTYDWTGSSFQEKQSSGSSAMALGLAVIMVFLILAALYERWSLPLSVLLALPFGTFGALAAVYLRDFTNDVYFQIGLVTLLGLAAKNAILIVEYALYKVEDGMSATAGAMEAARLRFRPIIMTSLAFILGVVPLAFSSGAGAGARQSVGTGVMGGMLAATFLAVFFLPFFFKLLMDRNLKTNPADFEKKED
ncbi:multidrug efflux RND transporter permease subunit [Cocleimonas sp. KMM 6892]|uniref:efflux RND transporter permease subunit n=1 Tax=unclassified Cocleimonas TaxID=2639732 RepID=UPI002DB6348C|nr:MULTISPECIES: multidrug efflux RND transporter permease subunit [unclassified Cocleimonas]MEB8430831.1 multidrug efflux RND transporter permease subunit [Cocleimonas sp. KMM 6892]MEC4714397.1 multidrug efflux RND transporter permease subunit [Cocleimonas sp. KMM 6895]MEC4743728.1 multidrug efflux RND transporter permease subunit [Cocleimonas sp. KMM 6896]